MYAGQFYRWLAGRALGEDHWSVVDAHDLHGMLGTSPCLQTVPL
jgi:hypothetical protein